MILLLETATSTCSVALAHNGQLIAERHSDQPNAHSSQLSLFIQSLLKENGLQSKDIQTVCVSSGPGSYTGLRIGVSSAKGFCYALQIPLLAVSTLESMAAYYYSQHPDYRGMVCSMIDARRMECYSAIFGPADTGVRPQQIKEVSADIIEPGCYDRYLDRGEVTFIGDGALKTEPILGNHRNARYDASFSINAMGMALIAEEKLAHNEFEDVAYFEPFYLKDFVAKKSVVRGLS